MARKTQERECSQKQQEILNTLARAKVWRDLRNKIIHRLVIYSYKTDPKNRVTRKEVEQVIYEGKKLAEMLRLKTFSKIRNKDYSF